MAAAWGDAVRGMQGGRFVESEGEGEGEQARDMVRSSRNQTMAVGEVGHDEFPPRPSQVQGQGQGQCGEERGLLPQRYVSSAVNCQANAGGR